MINGNLVFKVEIKKKIALGVLLMTGAFATADYVSFLKTDTSGGFEIKKETMIVGTVVIRVDSVNPSTIYGGTWELIKGDATLGLGDGSDLSASLISGDNNPLVPVPAHSHNFTGNPLPNHSHSITMYTSNGTDSSAEEAFSKYADYSSGTVTTNAVSAGTPTGTISTTGVSNARMDVRGARLLVNVWKRVG